MKKLFLTIALMFILFLWLKQPDERVIGIEITEISNLDTKVTTVIHSPLRTTKLQWEWLLWTGGEK